MNLLLILPFLASLIALIGIRAKLLSKTRSSFVRYGALALFAITLVVLESFFPGSAAYANEAAGG